MKRIILLCRHTRRRTTTSCVLALPADGLNLCDLHQALLDAFDFRDDEESWTFSSPDGAKRCGLFPDGDAGPDRGMSSRDPISAHLSKEKDVLACSWEDDAGKPLRAEVEFLRTDEGEGPECLEVSGPKSGPHKTDLDEINQYLREDFGEEDEDDDGDDPFLFSGNLEEDMDSLPSELRDAMENMFRGNPIARQGLLHTRGFPWRNPAENPPSAPAEEIELDDTPVDSARLGLAHALALRIWKLAPWERLEEECVAVLKLADGRERVLSPMGMLGEYHALAFYPDFATFRAVHDFSGCGDNPLTGLVFWQWQLAFLKSSELLPGEAAAIKAGGLKFARGHLPSLECFAPGFLPHPVGGRELADLVELLGAAVALYSDPKAMDKLPENPSAGSVPVWTRTPDGNGWRLKREPRPAELCFPLDLPPSLLARLRALPVKDRVVSFAEAIAPVGEPGTRRQAYRIPLAADETAGFPAPPNLPETANTPPRVLRPSDTLAKLAETLLAPPFGYMPARLATPGCYLPRFLKRLAELHGGNVRYDPRAPTATVEAFQNELDGLLSR